MLPPGATDEEGVMLAGDWVPVFPGALVDVGWVLDGFVVGDITAGGGGARVFVLLLVGVACAGGLVFVDVLVGCVTGVFEGVGVFVGGDTGVFDGVGVLVGVFFPGAEVLEGVGLAGFGVSVGVGCEGPLPAYIT